MNKLSILVIVAFSLAVPATGQRAAISLTFSSVNGETWIQPDSIKVMNRTQGGDTVLFYPDTILMLEYMVGLKDPAIETMSFQV